MRFAGFDTDHFVRSAVTFAGRMLSVGKQSRRPKFCCKVAVIFLALYATVGVLFCSNDRIPAENADFYFEGIVCRGSGFITPRSGSIRRKCSAKEI